MSAIMLKLSFKPLIMFLREWKGPRELNSHSRLKRIITPLRQFQTWVFNTPEDYYDVTMSVCLLLSLCLLSTTRPGALQKPWNRSQERGKLGASAEGKQQDQADAGAPSCWRPAGGRGWGAAAILYYNMTFFVHQSGHRDEAIALLCEDCKTIW